MDVALMIARVWPERPAAVEVLGGGITNHNFKVTVDDGVFVLRIVGRGTELLGIDRRVEYEASVAAAALGVGPEVVAFVEPEGYLVTRFIEGHIVPFDRMREPSSIERVAQSLRAVHAGPLLAGRFNAFRVVEDYRATAVVHSSAVPATYAWARGIARRIERARGAYSEKLCHNDLLNANFIDDGTRIRIVDWEYAGTGDPFFDLANFSINHSFDPAGRRQLLDAYFGSVRSADERALELMRFMSDFREAMWGVVQAAVSEIEFDFAGYAAEHFERLQAIAREPEFQAALGTV